MAGAAKGKKKLHTGRHASAIKRARQNTKRRTLNRGQVKGMRDAIKLVRSAIGSKNIAAATTALKKAVPVISTLGRKGKIPFERASRYISRLTVAVAKLAA